VGQLTKEKSDMLKRKKEIDDAKNAMLEKITVAPYWLPTEGQ